MSPSNGAFVIREATAADVDIIVHHRRSMFADMGKSSERGREAMARTAHPMIEAALKDGSYRGWLVEIDGRVIAGGGVHIVPFQPTPMYPDPRRAWILNVYTEPEFRRQGFARLVLETILMWCRKEGLKRVFLHSSDFGRPLYESLGFEPTTEMKLVLK